MPRDWSCWICIKIPCYYVVLMCPELRHGHLPGKIRVWDRARLCFQSVVGFQRDYCGEIMFKWNSTLSSPKRPPTTIMIFVLPVSFRILLPWKGHTQEGHLSIPTLTNYTTHICNKLTQHLEDQTTFWLSSESEKMMGSGGLELIGSGGCRLSHKLRRLLCDPTAANIYICTLENNRI